MIDIYAGCSFAFCLHACFLLVYTIQNKSSVHWSILVFFWGHKAKCKFVIQIETSTKMCAINQSLPVRWEFWQSKYDWSMKYFIDAKESSSGKENWANCLYAALLSASICLWWSLAKYMLIKGWHRISCYIILYIYVTIINVPEYFYTSVWHAAELTLLLQFINKSN